MIEPTPLVAIAVPAAGAVGIAITGRWPNVREAVTLLSSLLLLLVVGGLWQASGALGTDGAAVAAAAARRWSGPEIAPGLALSFQVEPLGLIYAGIAAALWLPNSIYSIGYMRAHHERHQTRFYVCFALALASVMGIAFAGDLFTLFLFYEVLTLSTYPLVTHSGTDEARRSGRIYLGFLLGTSMLLLLLGIVWTWALAGTASFQPGGILPPAPPGVRAALFLLLMLGVGKAAVMPFHFWLPAAMVAPTPVSALLHAVAVVKAGVFIVLKLAVYVFGLDLVAFGVGHEPLLYMAGGTILIGSLVAVTRDNLKARLAYSTVSQLSYIVLGAALGTQMGIVGGGMHIVMHGFAKITLFFCAGAIYISTHRTKVSQLVGIGRTMPITMAAFGLASLSIIGIPPLGGAWSKWFLGLATLQAKHPGLLVVLLVSSALNVAYLLPIAVRAFFLPPPAPVHTARPGEAPLPCLIAICATALGTLALFFFPGPIYRALSHVVGAP